MRKRAKFSSCAFIAGRRGYWSLEMMPAGRTAPEKSDSIVGAIFTEESSIMFLLTSNTLLTGTESIMTPSLFNYPWFHCQFSSIPHLLLHSCNRNLILNRFLCPCLLSRPGVYEKSSMKLTKTNNILELSNFSKTYSGYLAPAPELVKLFMSKAIWCHC